MTTARKPQPQFTIQTIGQPCPSLLVGWAELLAIKAEEMSPRLIKPAAANDPAAESPASGKKRG
ncbi:hypothetical protein MTYP_01001 [Methylophilaceae bacterium]|nr:hypothetical protein MTYP_01001 [Methylophilaceae bacterium]